jgi:hypothetical protein
MMHIAGLLKVQQLNLVKLLGMPLDCMLMMMQMRSCALLQHCFPEPQALNTKCTALAGSDAVWWFGVHCVCNTGYFLT